MSDEKTFDEKCQELELDLYETRLQKRPIYVCDSTIGAYNLEGCPSQFLTIWKHKMKKFGLWNEKWVTFFEMLQKFIVSITFSHKQRFITGPNNTRSYYNDDSMIYICQTGQTIRVSYANIVFLGGTMYDEKHDLYSSATAQEQWKFGGLYQSCIWLKSSPIRDAAKVDFFSALVELEQQYHLGLFLLTFENVLSCALDSQQSKRCSVLCSGLSKYLRESCVIL